MLSVVISIFVLKERSCSTSGWSKVSRSLFRFVAWRAADMNMAAMSAIICCKLLFTILFARMVMCKRNKKSEDWQAIFTLFIELFSFEDLPCPRTFVAGVAGSMISAPGIGIYLQTAVIIFGTCDVIVQQSTMLGEYFGVFRVFGKIFLSPGSFSYRTVLLRCLPDNGCIYISVRAPCVREW